MSNKEEDELFIKEIEKMIGIRVAWVREICNQLVAEEEEDSLEFKEWREGDIVHPPIPEFKEWKRAMLERLEQRDEAEFDPMSCPMEELEEEITKIGLLRSHFLQGVRHARIIIRAGTGGKIR